MLTSLHDSMALHLILTSEPLFIIHIHWTHYLFSDLLKVCSEFSKSAPVMPSHCRLYNNQYKRHSKSPGCMTCKGNHVKFAHFVLLLSVISEDTKHDFHIFFGH